MEECERVFLNLSAAERGSVLKRLLRIHANVAPSNPDAKEPEETLEEKVGRLELQLKDARNRLEVARTHTHSFYYASAIQQVRHYDPMFKTIRCTNFHCPNLFCPLIHPADPTEADALKVCKALDTHLFLFNRRDGIFQKSRRLDEKEKDGA